MLSVRPLSGGSMKDKLEKLRGGEGSHLDRLSENAGFLKFSHKKWGKSVEIEKQNDIIKRNEINKANRHRAVKSFL